MPRMSPVDFYELHVRPRLSLEGVYSSVEFTSTAGRYWRGPCPLHGGKNPSFSVDTETLAWRCFSDCQRGGSALGFMAGGEEPRGADYVEAVRIAAGVVGVDTAPIDRRDPEALRRHEEATKRADGLERVLGAARAALQTDAGAAARTYLEGRGFTAEALEDFGLVTAEVLALAETTDAGLGRTWLGRVVFPWRDRAGLVGGLVGRTVSEGTEGAPKYLYARGTAKGELVAFGLDVALRRRSEGLVLVEGLLDVLLLQSRGLLNVAAIGGAGGEFGPERWQALERWGVRAVTLALDRDEAGRKGIEAILEHRRNVPVSVNVSVVDPDALGDCKDPDAYVRAHGLEAFRARLAEAVPAALYETRTILEGVSPASPLHARETAVEGVLEVLAGAAPLHRDEALRELVGRTGFSDETLGRMADARTRSREEADARLRLEASLREAGEALRKGDTPAAIVQDLRDELVRVQSHGLEAPPPFSVDRLLEASNVSRPGRPSGWQSLDRPEPEGLGLRFCPEELSILAARTGHGKTSAMVGLLAHWLRDETIDPDAVTVFYSLEEPELRIFHRLVSLYSHEHGAAWSSSEVRDFHHDRSRTSWPGVGAREKALETLRRQSEGRLFVVHRSSWTVADLETHLRTLAHGRPIAGVLVDYLQRLPPEPGRYDRRDLEVSAVARRLKGLAVDLHVPIVTGAQINREAAKNSDVPRDAPFSSSAVQDAIKARRPRLEHLREGGSEQEADLILGLLNYRADYEEGDGHGATPARTPFEVGVLKNRYGAPGAWRALEFHGQYHRISDPKG